VLECVVNLSEGRDPTRLAALTAAAGDDLLDVHSDAHHHRTVLTLVGDAAPRAVAEAALELLDLREHHGVHPRLGVVDVVPFVALEGSTFADAVAARDAFSRWWAGEHDVPCFRYGPERSLPDVRREAFHGLAPDDGPTAPHPTAGATAVGARPVLVAYNVWLAGTDVVVARRLAADVRGDGLRALGLAVGDRVQVSMNLIDPLRIGPADAYDRVVDASRARGAAVAGAELVGLLPEAVLASVDAARWSELDLSADRTIEARLARRGT
jgi:glutamate formiminotransferase